MKRRVEAAAVIGNGVAVRQSTIPGAGRGLFATRDFATKELITEFWGERISRQEAVALRAHGKHEYLVSCTSDTCLQCCPEPEEGRGGGVFANDAKGPDNNSQVQRIWLEHIASTKVFLQALKPIASGDEILASYGTGFWEALDRFMGSDTSCSSDSSAGLMPRWAGWLYDSDDDDSDDGTADRARFIPPAAAAAAAWMTADGHDSDDVTAFAPHGKRARFIPPAAAAAAAWMIAGAHDSDDVTGYAPQAKRVRRLPPAAAAAAAWTTAETPPPRQGQQAVRRKGQLPAGSGVLRRLPVTVLSSRPVLAVRLPLQRLRTAAGAERLGVHRSLEHGGTGAGHGKAAAQQPQPAALLRDCSTGNSNTATVQQEPDSQSVGSPSSTQVGCWSGEGWGGLVGRASQALVLPPVKRVWRSCSSLPQDQRLAVAAAARPVTFAAGLGRPVVRRPSCTAGLPAGGGQQRQDVLQARAATAARPSAPAAGLGRPVVRAPSSVSRLPAAGGQQGQQHRQQVKAPCVAYPSSTAAAMQPPPPRPPSGVSRLPAAHEQRGHVSQFKAQPGSSAAVMQPPAPSSNLSKLPAAGGQQERHMVQADAARVARPSPPAAALGRPVVRLPSSVSRLPAAGGQPGRQLGAGSVAQPRGPAAVMGRPVVRPPSSVARLPTVGRQQGHHRQQAGAPTAAGPSSSAAVMRLLPPRAPSSTTRPPAAGGQQGQHVQQVQAPPAAFPKSSAAVMEPTPPCPLSRVAGLPAADRQGQDVAQDEAATAAVPAGPVEEAQVSPDRVCSVEDVQGVQQPALLLDQRGLSAGAVCPLTGAVYKVLNSLPGALLNRAREGEPQAFAEVAGICAATAVVEFRQLRPAAFGGRATEALQ